jgi:hypothetical protein
MKQSGAQYELNKLEFKMKKDNGVQNERRNCGSIRIKEFGVHYE